MSRNCILVFLLVLSLVTARLAAQQPTPPAAATQPAHTDVEPAIEAVYPALIQIHVVVSDYAGGRAQRYEAAGSGVIISPDGYAITNHHVAGKAAAIRCVLTNKQEFDAKRIGTDPLTDISLLKLDLSSAPGLKGKLPFARFGDSQSLKIGDPVLAMGCPLALSQSVTRGIVANKELIFSQKFSEPLLLEGENVGLLVRWIAHDAQILPGNSGGPLVNLQGEIVGINEINVGGRGLGGAIPADLVRSVVQQLMEKGHVSRSWIGADFQPLLHSGGLKDGVLLATVLQDSPAARAGLKPGDVVLSVNGTPVQVQFAEQLPPLNRLIFSAPVGSTLEVVYERDGQRKTARIKTQVREEAIGNEDESKEWGLVVEDLTEMDVRIKHLAARQGVLVSSIRSGGPAEQATPPILQDDLLLTINGKPITGREEFLRITSEITRGKTEPVATLAGLQRETEQLLSVIQVGIRTPQNPTPEARKAWLPVETQVLSRKLAKALGLDGKKGVRITHVYPESSAERAGLKVGDVLTMIDTQGIDASELQDSTVFETMVRAYRIGSKPEFTVIRGAATMKVSAELVEQPPPERQLPIYENVELDFKARDLSFEDRVHRKMQPVETGVLVTEAQRGGWAAVGGLQPSDLIQSVNGTTVRSIEDLKSLLEKAKRQRAEYVVILVERGIHTFFLELRPIWPEAAAPGK